MPVLHHSDALEARDQRDRPYLVVLRRVVSGVDLEARPGHAGADGEMVLVFAFRVEHRLGDELRVVERAGPFDGVFRVAPVAGAEACDLAIGFFPETALSWLGAQARKWIFNMGPSSSYLDIEEIEGIVVNQFLRGSLDPDVFEQVRLSAKEVGLDKIGAMARVNRSISPSQAFSLRDYERLNQASAALKGRVVCLTAGSGTSFQSPVADKASGRPLTERLVASDVMRRVESILSGLGAEVTVVAAEPEKAVDNRVQLIRQASPSLSISINCDSLDQPLANGVSAFYWGKPETGEIRSPIGHRAAELILKEVLARTTATDLGIHGRSWDILRLTSIPSIQLDIGYLSNPDEAGRLADPVFRQVLADAIVIAIQRLYLLEEDDEPTGTLALDDVRRFNPEL